MTAPDQVWMMVGQIFFLLFLGAALFLLERIRQGALGWWQTRRLHPLARSVMANKAVHTLLVELRAKTGADRANVYLFHNGQQFSNLNPVWRLSCTQETCKPGVTHDIDRLQNLLASTIWDGLEPLFKNMEAKDKHSSHVFIVETIPDGYFKRFLTSRGIKAKIVCPLLDPKGQVVGFVSLNYCTGEKILAFDGCSGACESCLGSSPVPASASSLAKAVKKMDCQQIIKELKETTANINYALMEA